MRVFTSLLFVVWLYLWMAILGIIFLPALLLPRWATIFGIRTYARVIRLGLRLICGVSTVLLTIGARNRASRSISGERFGPMPWKAA